MSIKPRKPTGSFVSDADVLTQSSPRVFRGPFTVSIHNSKTNFIGDSVLPDGPRAVAVSETGERHSILLEEDGLKTNTNPFSIIPSQALQPPTTGATLCQHNSSTKIQNISGSVAGSDRPRMNSAKRSKASRRYNNQKTRPVFTPRNIEKMTPRTRSEERILKALNSHVETQTESHANSTTTTTNVASTTTTTTNSIPTVPMAPTSISIPSPSSRLYHHMPVPPVPTTPLRQLPPRRFTRENMADMLDSPRRQQPLRILPRKKSTMQNFSELRSIASALTLITVVSWLFSTFFELEGILEIVGQLMQTLQNWIGRKEQPVTKAQMLVQYVRNIWP